MSEEQIVKKPCESKQSVEKISIAIAIPRECIYRQFEEQPGPCPRCGELLRSHSATYLIAAKRGKETSDSFIIGNDMGWFCAHCPTVVINPKDVSEFLSHGLPKWDTGAEFVVLGILDLDAIPEDKRDLPFGDDDNPLPLVKFTNISAAKDAEREEAGKKPTPPVTQRDSSLPFEERYEDVLQNIEFGIIQIYHEHPEMTNWEALKAVEALLRVYKAEARGREIAPPSLDSLAQEVYGMVETMCEWRLGRETFYDEEGKPSEISIVPITVDEIIACLKRVRKSIKRWTRRAGRRGYLAFVSQFILGPEEH